MNKKLLEQSIKKDLNEGLTYNQIIKKYNLKSNYLVKKVRGLKNENDYFKIAINKNIVDKLEGDQLSSLYAHFNNINSILKNKSIKKLNNYILNNLKETE